MAVVSNAFISAPPTELSKENQIQCLVMLLIWWEQDFLLEKTFFNKSRKRIHLNERCNLSVLWDFYGNSIVFCKV